MSTTSHSTEPLQLTEVQIQTLLNAAKEAQAAAYAPYSNFPVGAAVMLSDGAIFKGCNIENASFGLTVCAERVAIFRAIAEGHIDIVALSLVTNAPRIGRPCGACRQVIAEFSQGASPIIVITSIASGEYVVETIADLLPSAFTLL